MNKIKQAIRKSNDKDIIKKGIKIASVQSAENRAKQFLEIGFKFVILMGWTSAISKKIIVFVLGLFMVLYVVFPGKIYGIEWIFAAHPDNYNFTISSISQSF